MCEEKPGIWQNVEKTLNILMGKVFAEDTETCFAWLWTGRQVCPTSGVSNFLSKAYVWLRMGMTQIKRFSVWLRMGMTLEIKRCSTSLKEGFMEFIFTHWNLTQNQNNCTTGCCCQREAPRTQPTISFMPHNECCLPMFHCKYVVAAFKKIVVYFVILLCSFGG